MNTDEKQKPTGCSFIQAMQNSASEIKRIAAIALAGNHGHVTHNTREFRRIEGLSVEDWAEDMA